MLARVEDDFIESASGIGLMSVMIRNGARNHSGFDELRSGTDDADQFHFLGYGLASFYLTGLTPEEPAARSTGQARLHRFLFFAFPDERQK
jgi:hypothetical protein